MKLLFIFLGIVVIILITGIIWARTAKRPQLGVVHNQLSAIPDKPNCVSTQSGNPKQKMPPIAYSSTQLEAQKKLITIITQLPRATLLDQKSGYIWVVYRSAFFGFPDDVEFMFDDNQKVIHFRAAARLGHSDLGVNKKRMATISQQFAESP